MNITPTDPLMAIAEATYAAHRALKLYDRREERMVILYKDGSKTEFEAAYRGAIRAYSLLRGRSRALATAFEVVLGSPNSSYPSRRCGFERTLAHYHRPAPIHSLRRIAA